MDDPRPLASGNAAAASVLLTDLYELTMLQAYFDEGLAGTASFELFMRTLPRDRNFLLAAGLDQVLDYLATLRFTPADPPYPVIVADELRRLADRIDARN